jgi:hypothetical protein
VITRIAHIAPQQLSSSAATSQLHSALVIYIVIVHYTPLRHLQAHQHILSHAKIPTLTEKKMSSTAVTIAGIATRAFCCDDVVHCQLSTCFVEMHMVCKSHFSVAEMVICASLNLT